jgi:ABC-type Fe3+-siderophore transport system permease subunit
MKKYKFILLIILTFIFIIVKSSAFATQAPQVVQAQAQVVQAQDFDTFEPDIVPNIRVPEPNTLLLLGFGLLSLGLYGKKRFKNKKTINDQ